MSNFKSRPDTDVDFDSSDRVKSGVRDFVVDISGYEGPLDVLLALAREKRIDLTKLSMVELVDQYLSFFARHCRQDLELTADYLVMAAWLSYLKSRLLLPAAKADGEEPGGAEVIEALADQLRRLKAMEEAAASWLAQPRMGREHFVRGVSDAVRHQQRPSWASGYYDFLMTCVPKTVTKAPSVLRLAPIDLISVEEAIGRLQAFLDARPEWARLQDCLPPGLRDLKARSSLAAHLVASLELCRQEKAEVRQEGEVFSPIWVRKRPADQA